MLHSKNASGFWCTILSNIAESVGADLWPSLCPICAVFAVLFLNTITVRMFHYGRERAPFGYTRKPPDAPVEGLAARFTHSVRSSAYVGRLPERPAPFIPSRWLCGTSGSVGTATSGTPRSPLLADVPGTSFPVGPRIAHLSGASGLVGWLYAALATRLTPLAARTGPYGARRWLFRRIRYVRRSRPGGRSRRRERRTVVTSLLVVV